MRRHGPIFLTALLFGCSGSGSTGTPKDAGPTADVGKGTAGETIPPDGGASQTDAATDAADRPATDATTGATSDAATDATTSHASDAAIDAPSGGDSGLVPDGGSSSEGGTFPTPTGQWTIVTSNLAGLGSECGNMSNLSSKPDEDLLIAGIAQQGLWGSTNGGGTWTPMGQADAGSAVITNRTSQIVYDPVHPHTFWESGLYNAGGVYETTDDGVTFAWLGNVTHNDSVSVDFTDPLRQTLLAGTHEQSGHLFRSTNGGSAWTDIGPNLPAGTGFSTQVLVIDAMTHLLGAQEYNDTGAGLGIFRTIDGGQTWTQVFSSPVQDHPLVASDGSIYWSLVNNAGMARSVDNGQTWATTVGTGVIATSTPIELPDGRIASLGPQAVMISSDHGTTWHAVSVPFPTSDAGAAYAAVGLVYSQYEKAFFIWHFDCVAFTFPQDLVPADAIERFEFDYTTN